MYQNSFTALQNPETNRTNPQQVIQNENESEDGVVEHFKVERSVRNFEPRGISGARESDTCR